MSSAARTYITLACLLAGMSVVLGAFAAHGLKASLPENLLAAFRTGVDYQAYHAIAIIVLSLIAETLLEPKPRMLMYKANLFLVAGITLFSGSLYVLALSEVAVFGAITPLGGLALILGWVIAAKSVYSSRIYKPSESEERG